MYAPFPTQTDAQVALRAVLLAVLPPGVEVVEGLNNRVSEPQVADYVVMTVVRRERLSFNLEAWADCAFQASASGSTLTVASVSLGSLVVGNALFGPSVAAGTVVTGQTTGTAGGPGSYSISPPQSLSSGRYAMGATALTQPTRVVVQLDVHSDDLGRASDLAQTISTLLRSSYGVAQFAAQNLDAAPLYVDDPKQIPFQNAEQQYESRYVVEVALQVNQSVLVPQDFADEVTIPRTAVDAAYPA